MVFLAECNVIPCMAADKSWIDIREVCRDDGIEFLPQSLDANCMFTGCSWCSGYVEAYGHDCKHFELIEEMCMRFPWLQERCGISKALDIGAG